MTDQLHIYMIKASTVPAFPERELFWDIHYYNVTQHDVQTTTNVLPLGLHLGALIMIVLYNAHHLWFET